MNLLPCPFCGSEAELNSLRARCSSYGEGCPCEYEWVTIEKWEQRQSISGTSGLRMLIAELEAYKALSGARTAMEYALWMESEKAMQREDISLICDSFLIELRQFLEIHWGNSEAVGALGFSEGLFRKLFHGYIATKEKTE